MWTSAWNKLQCLLELKEKEKLHTKTFQTQKALVDNWRWILPLEKDTPVLLPASFSLSLHLPPAGSAAENSDCTVVRRRATLTARHNKASLFPREWGRETYRQSGGLHHYLLKHHYQAEEKRTVGNRAGKPVSEMEDLTCRSPGPSAGRQVQLSCRSAGSCSQKAVFEPLLLPFSTHLIPVFLFCFNVSALFLVMETKACFRCTLCCTQSNAVTQWLVHLWPLWS